MGQRSKNLKHELGEQSDHHCKEKFHGESIDESLEALKRCLDPEMAQKALDGAKKLKYEQGEMSDHHFKVKFHGELNSFDVLKR